MLAHRNQGNALPTFTGLLSLGCCNGYRGRDTSGEVWKGLTGISCASVSMELGCVTQSGSSSNPILDGFSWRLHYVDMIDYELPLKPPPLPGGWRWGFHVSPLSLWLGLPGHLPHAEALGSSPIVTSLETKMLLSPRKPHGT